MTMMPASIVLEESKALTVHVAIDRGAGRYSDAELVPGLTAALPWQCPNAHVLRGGGRIDGHLRDHHSPMKTTRGRANR